MEPHTDVLQDSSLAASEGVISQKEEVGTQEVVSTIPTPPKGSQTPSENLYAALAEERRLRKEAEDKLNQLNTSAFSEPEVFSDEGKVLKSEINSLKSELSEVKGELTKKDLFISYPVLKDKWKEFEEFRSQSDNAGMNMRTAAKAFLVENGFFDIPRKGLEKPTGGPRNPMTSGMTADDVKNLRETNYRKYQELLKKGQLKIEQ